MGSPLWPAASVPRGKMGVRNVRKISFLGNFPPRQCGIATFSRDLHQAVSRQRPEWSTPVLSVTDPGYHYDYPDVVRYELPERSFSSYQRAPPCQERSPPGLTRPPGGQPSHHETDL